MLKLIIKLACWLRLRHLEKATARPDFDPAVSREIDLLLAILEGNHG